MAEKRIESQAVDIINNNEIAKAGGPTGGIELLNDVVTGKELDFEVFMRQEVEVTLAEAPTENDAGFVEINVNGDYRCFVRGGDPVMMRRYHLAVLAQAKVSRVRQDKITSADGSMSFQEKTVISQAYPFSVVQDPAGRRGYDWLKQQLQNPA